MSKLNIPKPRILRFNMKLKIPELNTKQAITIALLIGLLYMGAYIYGQHRLTIEHNANIQKWCLTNAKHFEGVTSNDKLRVCHRYFGEYHLPFKNKDYKKDVSF